WFARTLLLVVVATFWLGYPLVWTAFDLNGRTASWGDSIGPISYQFYALLAFSGLTLLMLRGQESQREPRPRTSAAF
ncbi:MAG: hypothetical protein ACP5XB_21695, partial [Isosphaeraceae bacterium]